VRKVRTKPVKRLRQELGFLALVLAVPVAVAAVFPYGAVGFKAPRAVAGPSCRLAFVRLSAESEEAALEKSRASWSGSHESVRGLSLNLSAADLPEDRPVPVSDISWRSRPRGAGADFFAPTPLPPSLAAPEAGAAPREEAPQVRETEAFPRSEMLATDMDFKERKIQ